MATVRREGGKVYIPGVRRLSWDTGEFCEFASALRAALETLGDDVSYARIMGFSGAAFRFSLAADVWNPGSYGVRHMAADPYAVVHRTLPSLGHAYTLCQRGDPAADTARIVAAIDRGTPVPAFGVVGPADCSVVAGYDESGRVLLGWSTYQDIPDDHDVPPDPTGYFRQPDWHRRTPAYVLIGERAAPPPRRQTYLAALRWAVHLARTPRVGSGYGGLSAYAVWAEAIARDANFPADDAEVMSERYLGIAASVVMIDDHRCAAPFLGQIAAEEPDLAPELLAAAQSYEAAGALNDALSTLMPGDFSPGAMAQLYDPAVRRRYADIVRQIAAEEERAITWIERGLARLSAAGPPVPAPG